MSYLLLFIPQMLGSFSKRTDFCTVGCPFCERDLIPKQLEYGAKQCSSSWKLVSSSNEVELLVWLQVPCSVQRVFPLPWELPTSPARQQPRQARANPSEILHIAGMTSRSAPSGMQMETRRILNSYGHLQAFRKQCFYKTVFL